MARYPTTREKVAVSQSTRPTQGADASTLFARESGHWPIHLVGLTMLVIAAAAVFVLGLRPLTMAKNEAARLATELVSQREALATAQASLTRGQAELDALRSQLAGAALTLHDPSLLNQRLANLTELARESELVVQKVQPDEPISGRDFERVTIQLAGEATYPTLTRFVRRLHKELPDVEVRSLSLQASGAELATASPFRLECLWYARTHLRRAAVDVGRDP